MPSRLAAIVFFLFPGWLHAQLRDSLSLNNVPIESVPVRVNNGLDSIEVYAAKEYYSFRNLYDSVSARADFQISTLQRRIDSLQNLQLRTDRFKNKLDSIQQWKNEKLKSITSKVEELKSKVAKKIDSLHLPPAFQKKARELSSLMDKLDVTLPSTTLPLSFQQKLDSVIPDLNGSLSSMNISNIDMPDVSSALSSQSLQDVTNLNLPSTDIGNLGGQVKEYQDQLSQLPTDIDGAAKLAEEQANNISVVTDVQKELGQLGELTTMAGKLRDDEALKQELMQQAKDQAIDHFAGRQEQLQKAMESVAKYKQKFPTISSLNDLPKKRPNEMKDKPFIERLVPGIAIQLQKKDDDLLTDFNLYLGYRFTRRFTGGAGWNQRVGYNTDRNSWSHENGRIYGPRVFSEYKIGKGFSPRVEVEVMNTFVPPYIKSAPIDPGTKQWVWGAFMGIKKDYKFFKKINGTAMVMLRLFDPHRKSPYADVINARFGFEFPMKKRVKAGQD